jgi:hypothetical protein
VRTDLFREDEGWITDMSRAFIRRGLINLFGRGGGIVEGETPVTVRNWIIWRLLECGLDPNGLRGWNRPYELVRAFQFVKYPPNGNVEPLTKESIWIINDDVPIRVICRPIWFPLYGGNNACRQYFGGDAENQGVFYGNSGRFPLRVETDLPGELARPKTFS